MLTFYVTVLRDQENRLDSSIHHKFKQANKQYFV